MSNNFKINIAYGIALVAALLTLIFVGFVQGNFAGYIVWITVSIIGGVVVLAIKHRLRTWWIWIVLFVSAGLGFPIAALCLKYKERG